MNDKQNDRESPLEINPKNLPRKPLYITDGFGDIYQVSRITLDSDGLLKSVKSNEFIDTKILGLYYPANTFLWNDQEGKLRLLIESQFVLIKIEKLFEVIWHYGIINMNGIITTLNKDVYYYPHQCAEIWIVSKYEYLCNTSKCWMESNPEHAWRRNPNTNDYII